MENATYVALSRQMVLQHQMDVISNNLANMTTPAYKGESLLFVEYLNDTSDGSPFFLGWASMSSSTSAVTAWLAMGRKSPRLSNR